MDTISALVFGNVFGRFPRLQLVSVEHGCEWLPYLVHRMDKMRGMGRNGPWIGGKLTERPSEIVRRHVVAAAYPEDNVAKVVGELGHSDSVALGSDYPHAEGLAEPSEFFSQVDSLSDEDQRKIMHDNGRRLVLGGPA
jgi:predicted TIM-barrel fold metal-dependent hydrolase